MLRVLPDFDENGYLPRGCYEPTIEEIEERFHKEFPDSNTRSNIFKGYVNYSIQVCDSIKAANKQLINGSFTTIKKNPSDIDLLLIIDSESFNIDENRILTRFLNNNFILEMFNCHTFALMKYPKNKPELYKKYLKKKAYWLDCWGSDRVDTPKGLVKVQMEKTSFLRCRK